MNTAKVYQDLEGNDCSIWQMIQREPEWAANRIQQGDAYFQAVDDALVCWEMTTTGNAKVDLNKLLCIEQQVVVDPAVSDSARALQRQTAKEIMSLVARQKLCHDDEFLLFAAIKEKFGLEI